LVAVMVGCLDDMHGSCGAGSGGFLRNGELHDSYSILGFSIFLLLFGRSGVCMISD
jgi:hypothetical protein